MARRRFSEDPVSRLAIWARRLVLFALVATLLSIIIVRSGLLEVFPALMTFGGALALAMIAMLLALASFVPIWKDGAAGIGSALSTLLIGAALLAYPGYLGLKAYRLPAIADITTDPIDPPRFESIAKLRSRESNPVIYAGLYAAEQQRTAYPQIEPLFLSASPTIAYQTAMALITKRKWRIVDAREPQGKVREGRIEAVARTPIMGFRDDIVLRFRAGEEGVRIDMRSASRYGRHDFGTNASRIRSLLDDLDDAASTAQEKQERQELRERQEKQARKPGQKKEAQTKGQAPKR